MTTEKATPPGIALDNEALDKLEALARAATPGPWHSSDGYADNGQFSGIDICADDGTVLLSEDSGPGTKDALFMAAANPAAIIALIAQARAAQPQPSAAPAGMQADTNEATPNTCYKGWKVENLYREVERLSAQLSAARQGQGGGVEIGWITTGDVEHGSDGPEISDWDIEWDRKLIDTLPQFCVPETTYGVYLGAVPQPTAAPTPQAALEEMEARKDAAYLERNQVVAALARCFPSGTAKTAIEGWSEDWHGCVYIDLPTGQVSWHFHDSQAYLFDGLPQYAGKWDGHDTTEKYRRVAALAPTPHEQEARAAVPDDTQAAVDAFTGWLQGRGPLGPGSVSERIFFAGWQAGKFHSSTAQAGMLPVAQTDAARDVAIDPHVEMFRQESRIAGLRTALKEISEVRFGFDGDCGVALIADTAIFADDEAQRK